MPVVLPLTVIAFFMAFASWTLFSVIGVHIKQALDLSSTGFALLLATPVLAGGVLSVLFGAMAQAFGGRRVLIGCLFGLQCALGLLMIVDSYVGFLLAGVGLGMAGGAFSAGLHYLAAFLPPARAGIVLGCYGAGMAGASFNYLLVPVVHDAYSWQSAPLAYIFVLLLVLLLLVVLTPPEPGGAPVSPPHRLADSLHLLQQPQVWQLALYLGFFLGGFVALSLWLPDSLSAHFGLPVATGAALALVFAVPAALSQILGGVLADRLTPHVVLRRALIACLCFLFILSYPVTRMTVTGIDQLFHFELGLALPAMLATILALSVVMGLGVGSLLRLLFDMYPAQVGSAGSVMLFAACMSAFALPLLFGVANDLVGVRSVMFMILFLFAAVCTLVLQISRRQQERAELMRHCPEAESAHQKLPT